MFRDIGRNQSNLIPPSLSDLIPADDIVFTVIDVVDRLDLTKLYSRYHRLGQHAYHPKMMLALLFYSYSQGIFSSRKISETIKDSIRLLYLTGYQYPDYHTVARFRKKHADLLEDYFAQIVRLCIRDGLAPLDGVSIDGTKVKANASPNRQSEWLLRLSATEDEESHSPPSGFSDSDCKFFKGVGPAYNAQAAVDAATQLILGVKVVADINDSQQLIPMIDEVNQVTQSVDKKKKVYADTGYSSAKTYARLEEYENIDAYVPVREGTAHPANHPYAANKFTIDLENCTGSCPQGFPMQVHRRLYKNRQGYNVTSFRGTNCDKCPAKSQCTKSRYRSVVVLIDQPFREKMRRKMNTPAGVRAMRIRRSTVEPVFGIIKEILGFRRFSLRSLKSVNAEWLLVAIAFNLRKINKHRTAPPSSDRISITQYIFCLLIILRQIVQNIASDINHRIKLSHKRCRLNFCA